MKIIPSHFQIRTQLYNTWFRWGSYHFHGCVSVIWWNLMSVGCLQTTYIQTHLPWGGISWPCTTCRTFPHLGADGVSDSNKAATEINSCLYNGLSLPQKIRFSLEVKRNNANAYKKQYCKHLITKIPWETCMPFAWKVLGKSSHPRYSYMFSVLSDEINCTLNIHCTTYAPIPYGERQCQPCPQAVFKLFLPIPNCSHAHKLQRLLVKCHVHSHRLLHIYVEVYGIVHCAFSIQI